jgi:flagellar biosynthetic protein FliP
VVASGFFITGVGTAQAAPTPSPSPTAELPVSIQLPQLTGQSGPGPSNSLVLLLTLTVLSVAPALLLMTTSFTQIIVVLSLTRNALGLQGIPPNQVLAGLALFLSFFVMSPVISQVNTTAVQPYLKGDLTFSQAYDRGSVPMRSFMLKNTRPEELALMVTLSKQPPPKTKDDVSLATLVPAFVLSQLRSAFIIGIVIFIPFLIIDLVVSAGLMSVGMMMVPPVVVSLPFKLLLFVLVDGWGLVINAVVGGFTV